MDAVEVLIERAREAAIAAGRLFTALLEVDDAAIAGFGADEIAFALHWSSSAAHTQLATARYLRDVVPDVFTALCAGDLDAHRAWIFFDVLRTADDLVATQVATRVLPQATTLTASELRRKLRHALITADPHGAGERTRRGIDGRYVGSTADTDGTASLYAVRLPAARAAAAFERVDAFARGAKTAGDARTLDQLRADTFLDLLEGVAIGTSPIHRRGIIELTIPLATATGASDEPGDLAGYGPLDADTIRDLLTTLAAHNRPGYDASRADTNATPANTSMPHNGSYASNAVIDTASSNSYDWRYSIIGDDGTLLAHDKIRSTGRPAADGTPPAETDPSRRSPSPALSRWITARDRTCRAPGCTTPARTCDIDHTIDHARGGLTSHDNLGLLCRHHHRLRHEGGWTLTHPSPGHFEWQSPTNRVYRT